MNSRGKRMVQEDELTYLQELKAAHSDPSAEWGGGGSSLEAGAGIDITEGVLSVNYGAGLTVDDGTLVVDASTVAMKSEMPVMDNATIVKNAQNKYETAIGGSKETIELGIDIELSYSNSSYNITDSTLANTLFNALETGQQYPVTITLTGSSATKTITSAYIQTNSKTATKFGGGNTLHATDSGGSTHHWEFYVDISTNKINIWFGDSFASNGTLELVFLPYDVWQTINVNALPDVTTLINCGDGCGIGNDNKLYAPVIGTYPIDNKTKNFSVAGTTMSGTEISLNYDNSVFTLTKKDLEDTNASYVTLTSIIGGGYQNKIVVEKSDLTLSSGYRYNITNTDKKNEIFDLIIKAFNLSTNICVASRYTKTTSSSAYGRLDSPSVPVNYSVDSGTGYAHYWGGNGTFYPQLFEYDFYYDPSTQTILDSPSAPKLDIYSSNLADANFEYVTFIFGNIGTIGPNTNSSIPGRWGKKVPINVEYIPVDGTSITVDANGKLAATGGSSSGKYMHKVQIRCKASSTSLVFDDFVVTNSATAYTSAEDYLTDQGYTITTTSDNLTNYLTCMHSGGMVSIAVMSGVAYRADISIDASGDIVKQNSWSLVSDTVGITDTVIAL